MKELCLNVWYLFLILIIVYILVDLIIIQPINKKKQIKKRNELIDGMIKGLKESPKPKKKKKEDK